jgi:hypothetical protein
MAVHVERGVQHLDQTAREGCGFRRPGNCGLHDGEFVATEARDRVGFDDFTSETLGDGLQQRISYGMSERIIDRLSVILASAVNDG